MIWDGSHALVSLSPELFFEVTDGQLTARPMKGTRPRHADPAQDAAAAEELARSEKDRAENLMIVDLMRNDLSRVCEVGSVAVQGRELPDGAPDGQHGARRAETRHRPR